LIFFACGLMSKAMVVTIPFVMLLLDFWPLQRIQLPTRFLRNSDAPPPEARQTQSSAFSSFARTFWHLVVEKLPFFALSITSTVLGFVLLGHAGAIGETPEIGWGDRLIRAAIGYASYLRKTIWPAGLALPYPRIEAWTTGQAAISLVIILGISMLAIWVVRRRPAVLIGWLWFLGMLVPVIGLVQLGAHSIADRYTYLPVVGLFMAIVWGLSESPPGGTGRNFTKPGLAMSLICVVLLVVCAGASRAQLSYWRDSEQLYRHALDVTRNNFIAHNGLGLDLFKRGKVDEAITQFEAAIQINQAYDPAHSNLGRALAQQGKYQEAAAHLETALNLRPDDVKTRNNLGNVLASQGRHEEAVGQFVEVLRRDPNHASAHNNLALSYKKLGRTAEAIIQYREALRLQPDSLEALINLSWALATDPDPQFRNGAEAVQLATRACELTKYQHALALTTLSAAFAETGMFHEGIAFAEQAQAQVGKGQGPLQVRLATMLEGFHAGVPFREPPARP
jgi:Tfp pilus assembly protein PilF